MHTIGRRYFYLEKNEYHQVAASDFLWYIYIVKTFAEAFEMYKAPSDNALIFESGMKNRVDMGEGQQATCFSSLFKP